MNVIELIIIRIFKRKCTSIMRIATISPILNNIRNIETIIAWTTTRSLGKIKFTQAKIILKIAPVQDNDITIFSSKKIIYLDMYMLNYMVYIIIVLCKIQEREYQIDILLLFVFVIIQKLFYFLFNSLQCIIYRFYIFV